MAVDHYENFPVASWLCPPAIRAAVVAIYHFARTADDLADEGDVSQALRLSDLQSYRQALVATLAGHPEEADSRWRDVFQRLSQAHRRHQLPSQPLLDLLDAFEQDVANPVYDTRDELVDYCSRSANPIGRLLLHLQGHHETQLLHWSDRICTALQLINFWQDLSVDTRKGRHYIPRRDAFEHGLTWPPFMSAFDEAHARRLVADLCSWARQTMMDGADLPLAVGGRMGWELRFVVQGGLRVLEKIKRMDHETYRQRPTLGSRDLAPLLWRALCMRRRPYQSS